MHIIFRKHRLTNVIRYCNKCIKVVVIKTALRGARNDVKRKGAAAQIGARCKRMANYRPRSTCLQYLLDRRCGVWIRRQRERASHPVGIEHQFLSLQAVFSVVKSFKKTRYFWTEDQILNHSLEPDGLFSANEALVKWTLAGMYKVTNIDPDLA